MKLSVLTALRSEDTDADRFDETAESVWAASSSLKQWCSVEWVVECDGGPPGVDVPYWAKSGSHDAVLGTCGTRNLALSRSTGDLVLALDAGDLLLDLVSMISRLHADRNLGWAAATSVSLLSSGRIFHRASPGGTGPVAAGWPLDRWIETGVFPLTAVGPFVMRRHDAIEAGGWNVYGTTDDGINLAVAVTEGSPGWFVDEPAHMARKETVAASFAEIVALDRDDKSSRRLEDLRLRHRGHCLTSSDLPHVHLGSTAATR